KPLPLEDLLKAPLELLQKLPKDAPPIPLPSFEFPHLSAPRSKATSQLDGRPATSDPAPAPTPPTAN
ncbi:MAG: hypothetical protein ABW217_06775, partial [Polyangiaceae bacterium]